VRTTPQRAGLALLLLAAACTRGADAEARRRVLGTEPPPAAAPAPDLSDPAALLRLDAGEAARRLGSLDWRGAIRFTATRQGDSAARVEVSERHRLRQLATGEFEVESEIDGGAGPGGLTGKQVIHAGGMTWARARYAPFRERPTDRGRDARRFRDESFGLLADLARLYGQALQLTPAGDTTLLGRPARRFTLALAREAPVAPAAADGRVFGGGGPDADSRRHLAFLDGRVPVAASGEVVLDGATGVLLRARLAGAFGVKDDARVRVTLELTSEVKAIGVAVAAVTPPKAALLDSRKPPGVAASLEAAGLKAKEKKAERAEPTDEPEGP
jgi:hypothetical protein